MTVLLALAAIGFMFWGYQRMVRFAYFRSNGDPWAGLAAFLLGLVFLGASLFGLPR